MAHQVWAVLFVAVVAAILVAAFFTLEILINFWPWPKGKSINFSKTDRFLYSLGEELVDLDFKVKSSLARLVWYRKADNHYHGRHKKRPKYRGKWK